MLLSAWIEGWAAEKDIELDAAAEAEDDKQEDQEGSNGEQTEVQ